LFLPRHKPAAESKAELLRVTAEPIILLFFNAIVRFSHSVAFRHCFGFAMMSLYAAGAELTSRSRPLEWNEAEENRTRMFLERFSTKNGIGEEDVFAVVESHGGLWSAENAPLQQREMTLMKEKMLLMQREILRLFNDKVYSRWMTLSSGRRHALLLYALIDVDDLNQVNLCGRRQLCPELVVKDLAINPSSFVALLYQFTTGPRTTTESHPLIDAFLGFPKTNSWAHANIGQAMYIQSVLVSRSWYITMFLVTIVLRLIDSPICISSKFPYSPIFQNVNPIALHWSPPIESHLIPPAAILDSLDLEMISHRFARCTGCMEGLVDIRVWCKRCPDVQYCSKGCQETDWAEHCKTCGKKRQTDEVAL
jgi:hypothetical protein